MDRLPTPRWSIQQYIEIYVYFHQLTYTQWFKCPATIFLDKKTFIQIMINATIMVKVLIYKLLMNVKMRTKQKYVWWNLEINKTYHLCIIHQMCEVSKFINSHWECKIKWQKTHISWPVQQVMTTTIQHTLEIDHHSKLQKFNCI